MMPIMMRGYFFIKFSLLLLAFCSLTPRANPMCSAAIKQ
jgi:hypothetical protein